MLKFINRMQVRDERGFTLVELLIVIAIIAILAAIAIPQFASYRQRGIRSSMTSDARNASTMLEAFFSDNQSYPAPTATAGGTFILGSSTGRMSAGNTLTVTATASDYSIVVNNSNGGTGSTNTSLTNTGVVSWY